ncbi:MAG: pitrilysin family protein [Pseudomonadota bacterium]
MKRLITGFILAICASTPVRAEIDIQSVTSPGGITAWLVEEPSIPFIALEIRFRGGASLDDPDARGAVNLMGGLLEEGAADMDARAFKRAQEELATSLDFDVSRDELSVSARFLTENKDASVALLRAALQEPSFPEDAVERVRGQVLSIIQSDAKDPNDIAGQTLGALIYGDHPYAHPVNGTLESVRGLTREDLIAAHAGVLARDRVFVGVAGDISAGELGPMLDTLLGGLPETGAPMPARAEVDIPPGVTVVDYATPQSVARFVQPGISQKDPDYFAAILLNHVLGGGSFESRLTQEVRVKRGLTYGVYSYLLSRDLADVYIGAVSSSNDRIAEAMEVIRDEWRKAAETGLSAEDLDAAKTYITGAYPLRFDGNVRIANILVGMQLMDLPIDYTASRNDRVEAVTLDDVNRVAEELLAPESLHFVVVGQPLGIPASFGE